MVPSYTSLWLGLVGCSSIDPGDYLPGIDPILSLL